MLELRAQFWEVMKSLSAGEKFQLVTSLPPESLKKQFQLFEVLVVESLNRLDPALEWKVTQVSGDRGVDFRGTGPNRRFEILNLTICQTLLGQTKRRAGRNVKLFDDDLRKIGKLALSEKIAGVIFVFSSETLSAEALHEHFRDPDNSIPFRGAKYFVDARRFEDLWARDRTHVLNVLERCLTADKKQIVDEYLHSIAHSSHVELDVGLERDSIGRTGKRFRCCLKVSQRVPLPTFKVRLRYRPHPQETSRFEVLLPSHLAGSGLEVVLSGEGVTEFEFFVRCFVGGKRRLGTIRIETDSGILITEVDLGEREFLRTFEPPYFDKPNRGFHRNLTLRLSEVAAGEIHALAVLGAGGGGKSRFCEAVLEEAADLNFDWFSLGHDNSVNARRRLLRMLISGLLPKTSGALYERTVDWLKSRVRPFDQAHERALQIYFEKDVEGIATKVLVTTLLALFSERTRYRPLLIHLRDLHWADGETLSILGDAIDGLREAGGASCGVLFLLEGRDKESLRLQTGIYRPPEDWLAFLKARNYEQVELKPWISVESEQFLRDLIDTTRDPSEGAVSEALPLYEDLFEHIMQASSGSPMHIIEQLKSLVDSEYVKVTDKGTIYLKRRLPLQWRQVTTIEDLIIQRLELLKTRAPLAAELLGVVAKIGPRVPGSVFRFVCSRAEKMNSGLSELQRVDMAIIPRNDSESFEFHHENYYHVCRNWNIDDDAPYLSAAIDFYQGQSQLTPKQEFEVSFLMAHRSSPDYTTMTRHLTRGIEEANKAGDNLLCMEFYKFFLNLPENVRDQSGVDSADIKLQHGMKQIISGNWEESLETLKEAEIILSRRPHTQMLVTKRLICKIEIVDALVTLMRPDDALAQFEQGESTVNQFLSTNTLGSIESMRDLMEARDRLWLRCAVAHWFDGHLTEAAKWHRRAYVAGRSQNNLVTVGEALRELGTLMLHRHLGFGRRTLLRAIEYLEKANQYQTARLAQVEVLFADLLLAMWKGRMDSIASVKEQAMKLHYLCQESSSLYEAALLSLVAGSCWALDAEFEEAHHWFKLAITTAMRASAYEEIWKGRLNLSQVCLQMGSVAEARLHATEAAQTILVGLNTGGWNRRAARRAMMTWPLLHCIRAAPETEKQLSRYLTVYPSVATAQWQSRPPGISRIGQPYQVLHVRQGDSDYYLHT